MMQYAYSNYFYNISSVLLLCKLSNALQLQESNQITMKREMYNNKT